MFSPVLSRRWIFDEQGVHQPDEIFIGSSLASQAFVFEYVEILEEFAKRVVRKRLPVEACLSEGIPPARDDTATSSVLAIASIVSRSGLSWRPS